MTNFAALYGKCRVIATCRTHRADAGWQLDWPAVHELAPLSQEKIQQFIEAWYNTLSTIEAVRVADYSRKAAKLKDALAPEDPRQLDKLAGNPLLLTVMAIVHTHKNELPDSRVEVYAECVDILLHRWQPARTQGAAVKSLHDELSECGVRQATLYRALCEMALEAHRSGERRIFGGESARAVVTEGIIRKTMHKHLGNSGLEVFLHYCQSANGLLMAQGVVRSPEAPADTPPEPIYAFPHLTFEEYLAARYLRDMPRFADRAAEFAGDPAWREVVLFLGEYLCFDRGGNISDAQALLGKLCPNRAPADDADWRRIWLASGLLATIRSGTPEGERRTDLDKRIVQRLAKLLDSPNALASAPLDRAAVGRALSTLGDPRPGVTIKRVSATAAAEPMPDILWIPIPGTDHVRDSGHYPGFQGFKLGAGLKPDPEYQGTETWPQDAAAVEVAPFELAAYPITVAQFRPFMKNDGYSNAAYWTKEGWGWRQDQGRKAPSYWGDPMWYLDNHPVVGISWYEAVAYCRWLSQRLGKAVRLPTEAEWEWAARGPEARRWPWGDKWEEGRCNTEESGINRTTAVGTFPKGANWTRDFDEPSQGQVVYDLAGNVWEWCSTRWQENYPLPGLESEWTDAYLTGHELRVLRGGSWFLDQSWARAAFRNWILPAFRIYYVGFRCCVATFSDVLDSGGSGGGAPSGAQKRQRRKRAR